MEAEHKMLKSDNNFSTYKHEISSLRSKGTYSDVTLVCNGIFYPVHKLVLALSSEYFGEILEKTEGKTPMVILTGILSSDLESLLNFMYIGEVNVKKDDIPSLMNAAELLKVKGLVIQNEEPKRDSYSSMSDDQCPPLLEAEITSTDLSLTGYQTGFFSVFQNEVLLGQQNSFENTEDTNDMPKSNGTEDIVCTEIPSTDISDILQTIQDDTSCMSNHDDIELAENTSADLSQTGLCTPANQNPGILITEEQVEVLLEEQNSFENTEETNEMPESNGTEDILHTEIPSTDISDILQTIKDDTSCMSNHDDIELAGNPRKENGITTTYIDDRKITKRVSVALTNILRPTSKRRRRIINDISTSESPVINRNGISVLDGQKLKPSMLSIATDGKLKITPGRAPNSRITYFGGYLYRYDRLMETGQQSWRCVNGRCIGQIYTFDDKHITVINDRHHEHCYLPNLN